MMGMSHDASWAINGMSMTGDGQPSMPPLLTLQSGRSYVLTLRNDTAWWHPMHLHGHSFRVISRNGVSVPHRQWADTVLISPKETVDIAFVADNPGRTDDPFLAHQRRHKHRAEAGAQNDRQRAPEGFAQRVLYCRAFCKKCARHTVSKMSSKAARLQR